MILNMKKTPIVFYIDDVSVPVTDINFPAVSFCPGVIIKNAVEVAIEYRKIAEKLDSFILNASDLTISE
jgi:hypothetical protein